METKILQNVKDKIQDDENRASVVRKNVDKKLIYVKGNFNDIKSSIEDAKTRMKKKRNSLKMRKTKQLVQIM